MRHDPRVSYLVESGERWIDLRGVHVTGTARIVEEPDLLARVGDAMAVKYAGFSGDRAAMPDDTEGALLGGDRFVRGEGEPLVRGSKAFDER